MSLKISNKIIGFNKELDFFLKLYNQDNLPNCLMLQGLDGIGKFTLSLHLVSSFLKNNINNFDLKILKNMNLLILKKEDNEKEYKIEDIRKVIDFCKLKSTSPRFILIKNINFLNKNSINALLKLTEEPSKETYFIFTTSSLLPSSETLESRFFKKKIFLNKSFYKEIVNYYMENNNIENHKYKNEINDTPGDYIRKYFFNIDKDIEKLKKNNENLFYKILSEKLLRKKNYNIEYLKKIKMNLSLKNDFKNLYNKIF